MTIRETQFVTQWWKGTGHEMHVKMLNDLLVREGEESARKMALGILPEQLLTVAWNNFWKGLDK